MPNNDDPASGNPGPCPLCDTPPSESQARPVAVFRLDRDPQEILFCRCGRAVWLEGIGWLIAYRLIESLARNLSTRAPENYAYLKGALSVLMPTEFNSAVDIDDEEV